MVGSQSRMTAAATTGPARQPRPTSSVPATARKPKSRSRRSTDDNSATRANSAKRRAWRRSSAVGFLALTLLFDARGFAAEISEVVELCASDPAMAFNLDLIDGRRVEGKHPLHAHAAGNLAHGEHLPGAAALARDHQALEDLDALFVAFFDLDVDPDRVAGGEVGDVGARFARLDQFHDFRHGSNPQRHFSLAERARARTSRGCRPFRCDSCIMRTLLGSATILNGILAGATADRFVVGIPALRKLGVRTWAEYRRHADLAPAGMAFYPTLAIGGTILMIAAATRDRRAIPAAVLAAAGLLVTFKAAPNMLAIRDLDDERALRRRLDEFVRWSGLRGALQVGTFLTAAIALSI